MCYNISGQAYTTAQFHAGSLPISAHHLGVQKQHSYIITFVYVDVKCFFYIFEDSALFTIFQEFFSHMQQREVSICSGISFTICASNRQKAERSLQRAGIFNGDSYTLEERNNAERRSIDKAL